MDQEEEAKDFGLLGKTDNLAGLNPMADANAFEKAISIMMQSAVKTLVNQMQNPNQDQSMPKPDIQMIPNGVRISMSQPKERKSSKSKEIKITDDQIKKLESLPRASAKTTVRRFADKIVYEVSASGISSLNDIFISKLEQGYEIKALGKSKVFVNTIPVNLPLLRYGINDSAIILEFSSQQ